MTTAGSPVKPNGKLHELELYLRQRIRGQDQVLPRIVSLLQRGELGLTKPGRPRGSFLFLGPTGVGKTEVTLTFTGFLMSKEHLFRFDMSEYQTQESLGLLLGGKLGERGTLGMVYDKSRVGTLLFDETRSSTWEFPVPRPNRCWQDRGHVDVHRLSDEQGTLVPLRYV